MACGQFREDVLSHTEQTPDFHRQQGRDRRDRPKSFAALDPKWETEAGHRPADIEHQGGHAPPTGAPPGGRWGPTRRHRSWSTHGRASLRRVGGPVPLEHKRSAMFGHSSRGPR
jgi:hypothetical protein